MKKSRTKNRESQPQLQQKPRSSRFGPVQRLQVSETPVPKAEIPIQRATALGHQPSGGPTTPQGLPSSIQRGVENLSGYSMSDVKVFHNSPEAETMGVSGFTQGSEIHLGTGQEQHLAHEAWHVAQQKRGDVTPEIQMKGDSANANSRLEREADVMGQRALRETGPRRGTLAEGSPSQQVMQFAKGREDVQAWFGQLKEANVDTLNLYTHIQPDGYGDAGQLGFLYDTIESRKQALNVSNVRTYVAGEIYADEDVISAYEDSKSKKKGGKYEPDTFSQGKGNDFVQSNLSNQKKKLMALARLQSQNDGVWAASSNKAQKRQRDGRQASPLNGSQDWEIQYPVPMQGGGHDRLLKVKEMGNAILADGAKAGELHEGLGYGVPDISGSNSFNDLKRDEKRVLNKASDTINRTRVAIMADAWLASTKPHKNLEQDPRLGIMNSAVTNGGAGILVYMPGSLNGVEGITANRVSNHGNLSLYEVTIDATGSTLYVINGTFSQNFLRFCMNSITSGLILSGGEGLYAESLATTGDDAAPVMVARYGYQYLEVANALLNNHDNSQENVEMDTNAGTVKKSSKFEENGIVFIGGVCYVYNGQQLITLNAPVQRLNVVDGQPNQNWPDTAEMKYSSALTALYLPLSLNTTMSPAQPTAYTFAGAKAVFVQERTRLKEHMNWFDLIQ